MKVISFFSFKGGVGRTALMVNVGAILAKKGHTVLMIDMDLFAPGLTYHKLKGGYIHPEGRGLGISDLLAAFADRDVNSDTIPFIPPRMLIREMNIPREKLLRKSGRLMMIDAGASLSKIQQNGGITGVCGELKPGGVIPTIPNVTADKDEIPEKQAYRSLAEYIREDLENFEIPPIDGEGEPQKIDYVLIDCRTGFPELLDLSLGYLSDNMVIVSGLNDQNLTGMRETLRALDCRVAPGEMSDFVKVVLSPVPAGEDESVLTGLKNANEVIKKSLRPTRYGIPEISPEIRIIHYTPILAMSDDIMVFKHPDSLYVKEVGAIADEILSGGMKIVLEDELINKVQKETFDIIGEEKLYAPPMEKTHHIQDSNPIAQLPPWHWPIRDTGKHSEILEKIMPLNKNVPGDREILLNKICWSISLTKDEKKRACEAFFRLTEEQIKEFNIILDDERRNYMTLWRNQPQHRNQLIMNYFDHQKKWGSLIAESPEKADIIFIDDPFIGQGKFLDWEELPLYWLLLGKEGFLKGRGEDRIWKCIDKALEKTDGEKYAPVAELMLDIFSTAHVIAELRENIEKKALSVSKNDVRVLFKIAEVNIEKREGNNEIGIEALRNVVGSIIAEKVDDAIFCQSVASLIIKHVNELIPLCEKVINRTISLDPKYAVPWNSLGNLYQDHLSRYEDSEAAYRKAMELDPKYAYPWNGLGNLYQDHLSRYEDSEAAYRKAMELDPEFASPWNGLGNLYRNHLSRYEDSEAAYRKAIELDSKKPLPWHYLGTLYQNHLSRYEDSETAYRKAMELDPKLAAPWIGLGNLYQSHLSRYEESEAAYRKAIELDPKEVYPWNALGILYQSHLSRYEEAKDAYQKAIEIDPEYIAPRHNDVERALVENDIEYAKERLGESEKILKTDKDKRDQLMLELALALARGDKENVKKTHEKLQEIRKLIEDPSPWDYEAMKRFIDRLSNGARNLMKAWIGDVKHESYDIEPEKAYEEYIES